VRISGLLRWITIKSSELLLKLKIEIEPYRTLVKPENNIEDKLQRTMSSYNQDNFKRLTEITLSGKDEEIDTNKLKALQESIDHYFALYAPENIEFREFIKIISVYLTFIEKRPLHAPGIIFSGGDTVYENNGIYYCTGKKQFKKEDNSLCNFCVCHEI
jgi:uncharacterized protein (UPF0305 family)